MDKNKCPDCGGNSFTIYETYRHRAELENKGTELKIVEEGVTKNFGSHAQCDDCGYMLDLETVDVTF